MCVNCFECTSVYDCNNTCLGPAELDECGVCGGNGIPDGACDCFGSTLDGCGVCGGDNHADAGCGCFEPPPSGCDNTCGSTLEFDECGICGGISDCNNNGITDVCDEAFYLGAETGDVNHDMVTNVLDIVIIVEAILGND